MNKLTAAAVLLLTVAVLLLTVTANAAPPLVAAVPLAPQSAPVADDGWQFRLEPFVGAGVALMENRQLSLGIGLDLGTFPGRWPIVGGHDFGAFAATVDDDLKAGGIGLQLWQVADVDVWGGALVYRGEGVRADVALFAKRPFNLSW